MLLQEKILRAAKGQRGAPVRRLPGSWLADLAALGKAIVLCEACVRKWQPKGYGYRLRDIWPGQKFVLGECDACGVRCQGLLHLPEKEKG